jgi:hypothetical protein
MGGHDLKDFFNTFTRLGLVVLFTVIIVLFALGFWVGRLTAPEQVVTVYAQSPSGTETVTETQTPRYGFTENEIYLLAQLICGSKDTDGDGEYDFDFKKEVDSKQVDIVLGVVMNRVRSEKFPNTVTEVVMARNQFSVMPGNAEKMPSDIALERVGRWCAEYDAWETDTQNIPETHLYFNGNGKENCSY